MAIHQSRRHLPRETVEIRNLRHVTAHERNVGGFERRIRPGGTHGDVGVAKAVDMVISLPSLAEAICDWCELRRVKCLFKASTTIYNEGFVFEL
jgi:hypothetical protein